MNMKKIVLIILILAVSSVVFCACNDGGDDGIVPYDDIFVQNNRIKPFKDTLEADLGDGVEPFGKNDYNNAYIGAYDLLIVQKKITIGKELYDVYGFYSVNRKELITEIKYAEFDISHGMISLRTPEGLCSLIKTDGTPIIPESEGYRSDVVDGNFRPVGKKYVAVKDVGGRYFNLMKTDGGFLRGKDGKPYKFAGDYKTEIRAYDDYMIRVKAAAAGKGKSIAFYDLNGSGIADDGIAEPFRVMESTTAASTLNAFYLGDGKFYCYDTYAGDKDGYQYSFVGKNGVQYRKITQWLFDAAANTRKDLPLDRVFVSIVNAYNSEEVENMPDIEGYLKGGYSYVSAGYVIGSDKSGTFDQFIIDSDMNVLLSMVSHSGTNTVYGENNEDFREVLLTYVGGVGFNPTSIGDLVLYDTSGNVIFRKNGMYKNVYYNDGVVTAQVGFKKDGDKDDEVEYYYGAWNLKGEPLFEADLRKYDKMTYFVGDYALVETTTGDGKRICFLIDKQGIPRVEIKDIATAKKGTGYMYKAGAYVTRNVDGKNVYFGVKSYDGDVLIEADNTTIVIAKYGVNDVVVYRKSNDSWKIDILK